MVSTFFVLIIIAFFYFSIAGLGDEDVESIDENQIVKPVEVEKVKTNTGSNETIDASLMVIETLEKWIPPVVVLLIAVILISTILKMFGVTPFL